MKLGKQIGVKILFTYISPFLKIFDSRWKIFLYKKCLQSQNINIHLNQTKSELLGAKSQRNITVKVDLFVNNRSKDFSFNSIKTLLKWYKCGNITILNKQLNNILIDNIIFLQIAILTHITVAMDEMTFYG